MTEAGRRLMGGLLITAGVLAIGLSGLCTLVSGSFLFAEKLRPAELMTNVLLLAMFGGPPLFVGVGLMLLGRRLGWSKGDGRDGPGKAFRRIASMMMIVVGVVVALQGLMGLLAVLRAPVAAVGSLLSFAISAGLIYGGVLLWKDREALPAIDDTF